MASSSKRRFVLRRQPAVVDVGCGCRRSKLSSLFSSSSSSSPMPKQRNPKSSSSASAATNSRTTSYASSPSETSKWSATRKKKKMGAVEDSEAVVKESSDPYFDFRDSMLQMIVEKEMYAWDDLRDLLHRILSLNSPYHHHLILCAFAEIVNGFFSADSGGGAGEATGRRDGGW